MTTSAATATSAVRVKFFIDDDATFEECNGERRPLTEDEYKENSYQSCPDHRRAGTKVTCSACGEVWPCSVVKNKKRYRAAEVARHTQHQGCATCGRTDYTDIPYDEYLRYYGNPDAHVYLAIVAETQCGACKSWHRAASLYGIDFMHDSPEFRAIDLDTWLDDEAIDALPGYARDVAQEVVDKAKESQS